MRCVIVDDEPIARRGMKRLVERHANLEIAAILGSAEEALEFLKSESVDLIFLDIQMPGMTGVELARALPDKTLVIFTTAYSEYATEGFEVNAIDYLMKPISAERFDRAVEKAVNYNRLLAAADAEEERPVVSKEYIIVKADRRYIRIRIADIRFVEGLKDYVVIHLEGKKIVTRITIKAMEDLLPSDKFLRVNKSYIVNSDAIDSFDNNDIFIGTQEIAIGQTYKDKILSRLLDT